MTGCGELTTRDIVSRFLVSDDRRWVRCPTGCWPRRTFSPTYPGALVLAAPWPSTPLRREISAASS